MPDSHIYLSKEDTHPVQQQKLFKNVAAIEITELKDALAYAEFMLTKNMQEKEALMKENAEHGQVMFKVKTELEITENGKKKAEGEIRALSSKCRQIEESQKSIQEQAQSKLGLL